MPSSTQYVRAVRQVFDLDYSANSTSITAQDVDGYTFLCWCACATAGWVGYCYVAAQTSRTTNVWVPSAFKPASKPATYQAACLALYVRS